MPNDAHFTSADQGGDFLSAADIAAIFGVDVRTVHRWTADDADPRLHYLLKTPGLRGAYVFTREEVERFANYKPGANLAPEPEAASA